MSNEYADILIRIRPRLEKNNSLYPVEAVLDDGSKFLDGQMRLDKRDQEALLTAISDPEKYGKKLLVNKVTSEQVLR